MGDLITLFAYFLYPRTMVDAVRADVFDEINASLGNVLYVGERLHVADLVVVSPRPIRLRTLADRALRTWRPQYMTLHRHGAFREYKQQYGGRIDGIRRQLS